MRQENKDVMNAVRAADLVNSTGSGDLAGAVEKTCGVERSFTGVLVGASLQHAGQSWDFSQADSEQEEKEMRWSGLWMMN